MSYNVTQEEVDEQVNLELKHANLDYIGSYLRGGPRNARDIQVAEHREIKKRAAERPTKWMWVMDPTNPAIVHVVEVIVDQWADKCFVPEHLVRTFNLMVTSDETSTSHFVLSGETFTTDKCVNVGLIGKNQRTSNWKFWQLPEKQQMSQMVVGREFIRQVNDFLLDEDPSPGPAFWTAQKKPNAQEVMQISAARRQADEDFAQLARNKEMREAGRQANAYDSREKVAGQIKTEKTERRRRV